MTKLPVVSGRDTVKALERAGWYFARQSASHMIMAKTGFHATISVPDHRELDRGTLKGILRLANLSVEEFMLLLGKC